MSIRQASRRRERRALRHEVHYACTVIRERDFEVVGRVAADLSTNGLQVLTDARVLTGEPVRVVFQAPETKAWLTVHGTVARVLHGRRPNDWGRRLGIELESLTPVDAERLRASTAMLEASGASAR